MQDLRQCVRLATAAPSLHNSQPWRFRVGAEHVDVFADPDRRLDVLDPAGRELLISVGAALFNLRIAIRGGGNVPALELFPGDADPDLVARVHAGRAELPGPAVERLVATIPRRHTNRWPFVSAVVPADVVEALTTAAGHEDARLTMAGATARTAILGLSQEADRQLRARGGYRAELARWTRPAGGRHDGIPPTAIGPWDALERLPVRDFGVLQPQLMRTSERFEPYPTIMILATAGDDRRHWVAAGQALQRVLLVATDLGLATTPISQPVEMPAVRSMLTDTGAGDWAQMILRLGYGRPATASGRRPLADVLLPAAVPS